MLGRLETISASCIFAEDRHWVRLTIFLSLSVYDPRGTV